MSEQYWDPDRYARTARFVADPGAPLVRQQRHGFLIDSMALFDRPTELPGPLVDWLEAFAEPFAAAIPTGERAAFRFAQVIP